MLKWLKPAIDYLPRWLEFQMRLPHSSIERYYGLGIISGSLGGWDWFGHSGGLQGYITRTVVLPGQELTVSIMTNSVDGLAHFWVDGAIQILRTFARHGAPARRLRHWKGRWWGTRYLREARVETRYGKRG